MKKLILSNQLKKLKNKLNRMKTERKNSKSKIRT